MPPRSPAPMFATYCQKRLERREDGSSLINCAHIAGFAILSPKRRASCIKPCTSLKATCTGCFFISISAISHPFTTEGADRGRQVRDHVPRLLAERDHDLVRDPNVLDGTGGRPARTAAPSPG